MVSNVELVHSIKIGESLYLKLEYDITTRNTWVSMIYYDKILVQYPIDDAIKKIREIIREVDNFKTACEMIKL